jgi:hypothetical protein
VTTNIFSKYSPEAIEYAKSHGHEFCFRPNSTSTWCAVAGKYDFDHPKKTKTERLAEADAKIEVLERDLIAAQKGGADAAERARLAERRARSLVQELANARFEATSMGNVIVRRDATLTEIRISLQHELNSAHAVNSSQADEIHTLRAEAAEAKSESRQLRAAWSRLVGDPGLVLDPDRAKKQDVDDVLRTSLGGSPFGDKITGSVLEGFRRRGWNV